MKERSYRVILDGAILDGFDREQVIEKLSGAFKKDKRVIGKLLAAAPRPVKGGLDLATARKYQAILAKMGAGSRVEEETAEPQAAHPEKQLVKPQDKPPAPKPEPQPQDLDDAPRPEPPMARQEPVVAGVQAEPPAPPSGGVACPKCGYTPSSPEDVLLVRGDCPRCGLRVRKDLVIEEDESADAAYERIRARPELIYRDRVPASWDRKSAAAMYTFGLFLAVHAALVLLWIVSFVPVDTIPTQAGTLFLQAALLDWPGLLISCAIVVVSFVMPIFNRGLSWGQRMAEIEVLYTEESKVGGYYVSLAMRALIAVVLSLGLGWIVIWTGSYFGWYPGVWTEAAIVFGGGIVGWVASWIYAYSRSDIRSLADLAAGTVQVQEGPMPGGVVRKAWLLILAVAGSWLLLAGVIPLLISLIRKW